MPPFLRSRITNGLKNYGPRLSIQISIAIANFIVVQVCARILDTKEFGAYSLLLAVNGFALLFFFQPITEGINRFLREALASGRREEFQRIVARLAFISTIALVAACAFALVYLWGTNWAHGHIVPSLAFVGPAYFITYCLAAVLTVYFNAKASYRANVALGVGLPLLGSLIAIIATRVLPASSAVVTGALALTYATGVGATVAVRYRSAKTALVGILRRDSEEERKLQRHYLSFMWSLPFLSLAGYASMYGDRLLVGSFFPLTTVGQYAYMFVLTMNIVLASFNGYSASTFLHAMDKIGYATNAHARNRAAWIFFLLSAVFPVLFLPLILVYWVSPDQVVHIVFGSHATVPAGCLAILMSSAALFGGGMQMSLVGNLTKRQHTLIVPRWIILSGTLGAIVLNHPNIRAVCLTLLAGNLAFYTTVSILAWRMIATSRFAMPEVPSSAT
jgi:O-antigen/teichoic acid export membrane protein